MTVGGHVAEIARQGIWASLTGGWCYEPANSIFCNTVHLYTWFVLFVIPLLIGVFASDSLTLGVILAYLAFVGVLFVALKGVVSYLHRVFDTTEPEVKYTSERKSGSFDTPGSGSIVRRPYTAANDIEMVDLRDLRRRRRSSDNLAVAYTSWADPPAAPNSEEDLSGVLQCLQAINEDDSSSSSGSSKRSHSGLLEKRRPVMCGTEPVLLPTDSFELLPAAARRPSDSARHAPAFSTAARKLSEPLFEPGPRRPAFRRRDSATQMRRTQSSNDQTSVLSGYQFNRRSSAYYHRDSPGRDAGTSNQAEESPEKRQPPSKLKTDLANKNQNQPSSSGTTVVEMCNAMPSTSSHSDGPSSSTAMPVPPDLPTSSSSVLKRLTQAAYGDDHDFKGKITQFLEELIDRHPETLDVIESVRQNRLSNRPTGFSQDAEPRLSIGTRSQVRPRPFNSMVTANIRDGSHVAYDHEDTSEGAVHSFQDEHGVWWTYTFNDNGPGTALPLGSTRAINEFFSSTDDAADVPGYRRRHKRFASATGGYLRSLTQSADDGPSTSNSAVPVGRARIEKRRSESPTMENVISYANDDLLDAALRAELSSKHDLPGPSSVLGVAEGDNSRVRTKQRRRRRRMRVHSSSSDEGGGEYISVHPTNIFHPVAVPSASTPMPESLSVQRQFMNVAQAATRMYNSSSLPMPGPSSSALSAISARHRGLRMTLEAFADEQRRRVLHVPDGPREYVRLHMNSMETALSNEGTGPMSTSSQSICYPPIQKPGPRLKANYYYKLKPPFVLGQGVSVNLDRLSLAALFDRNNFITSFVVDVFLAELVTVLATLLICRGIYTDVSLLGFAFVVAGSHFSLLKSVQPDTASPVHGFNWLVTYSRPVYFCVMAATTLALDELTKVWAPSDGSVVEGWTFNFHEISEASPAEVITGLRDVASTMVLLLPLAFTMGLLPQVNTLVMHVFEQIDMHCFGGTASFSLWSAALAVLRSCLCVAILVVVGHFAFVFSPFETQHTAFAAYSALVVALAFATSRWSSNPAFVQLLFSELVPWHFPALISSCRKETTAAEVEETQQTPTRPQQAPEKDKSGASVEIEEQPKSEPSDEKKEPATSAGAANTVSEAVKATLITRLQSDLLFIVVVAPIIFALHCTSVFSATTPYFEVVVTCLCVSVGFINHYFYRQLRSHTPWKVFSKPLLRSHEYPMFESTSEAKMMWFERLHGWMLVFEKNILYPLLIVSYLTNYAWVLPPVLSSMSWSPTQTSWLCPLFSSVFAFRLSRTAFAQPQILYVPLIGALTFAFTGYGWYSRSAALESNSFLASVTPLHAVFVFAIAWPKVQELILKLNFVLAYIAPWQISWGSAFHAFAQPFSIPHTGMILAQAAISSLISAPLNPFLGSSFFLMSYVRPVKFWERDYNTKRVDHSNLRLSSQLDRGPMMDDSNLNAIFYEHLTCSLQTSLAGDLFLGRWAATVHAGDCFILASLYLNCLVHIVEIGNGFVTFQVRGLEFRGTYCHQREVEAISEDVADSGGFCCCTVGAAPGLLSINNMFALRWLAWEVTTAKYIIDGYSITDNSAVNLLQVHELRRLLVSLYVKCIVYYALTSPSFEKWLTNETILKALQPMLNHARYVDTDAIFCAANDEDYDVNVMGITKHNFVELYGPWIQHCFARRQERRAASESFLAPPANFQLLNSFCFALSVLGRRTLGAAAYNRHANAAESFLFGLHALFKGDLRITSSADEWVCSDPDILSTVISPAVRMALKLHQDHFAAADDVEEMSMLFERIEHYKTTLFISHEHDPCWRQAIINNVPSLLALRHMYDDGQDDYKIIMLNKMHLNMRVIKFNRECVRAFWAGQQQELIFLRNRNPERGSIQNARQVLRNMINSSADQPIGYPIYVSPLVTSFVETHHQVDRVIGPPMTFCRIASVIRNGFARLRNHFGTSTSSQLPQTATGPANPSAGGVSLLGPNLAQAGSTPAPYRKRATTGSVGAASSMGLAGSIAIDRLDDDSSVRTAASGMVAITPDPKPPPKPRRFYEKLADDDVGEQGLGGPEEASESSSIAARAPGPPPPTSPRLQHQASSYSDSFGNEAFVEITDVDKIFLRLNEPLKSTGEMLVQWPCEEWRKIGGQAAWPVKIIPGMRGSVAHVWRPFHASKACRSHYGTIYLVRVFACPSNAEITAPFFVPILLEGVVMITKDQLFLGTPSNDCKSLDDQSEDNDDEESYIDDDGHMTTRF